MTANQRRVVIVVCVVTAAALAIVALVGGLQSIEVLSWLAGIASLVIAVLTPVLARRDGTANQAPPPVPVGKDESRRALGNLYAGAALEDCLRECIDVGVALRDERLIDWARHELNGYPQDAKVPDYRVLLVQLIGVEQHASMTETGPVPPAEFDSSNRERLTTLKDEVRWGAGTISTVVSKARTDHTGYVVASLIADADSLLKPGHRHYKQVYWGVYRGWFEELLEAVRETAIVLLKEAAA